MRLDPITAAGPPVDRTEMPFTFAFNVTDVVYTIFEGYSGWNADPHDRVTVVSVRLYLRVVGGFGKTYADGDVITAREIPLTIEYTRICEVLPYKREI